jgi:hypothetical protein
VFIAGQGEGDVSMCPSLTMMEREGAFKIPATTSGKLLILIKFTGSTNGP